MSFSPSARSRRLDIGQVLFCVFVERDEVKVNKNAKKKTEAKIQPKRHL